MIELFSFANDDINKLTEWFRSNKLHVSLNGGKTHYVLFSHNHSVIPDNLHITIANQRMQRNSEVLDYIY